MISVTAVFGLGEGVTCGVDLAAAAAVGVGVGGTEVGAAVGVDCVWAHADSSTLVEEISTPIPDRRKNERRDRNNPE